ncbi:apses transcription factor StuA [Talaromyces proteolyticus]|uniref:Cell pattern formation-associated protein STUA n=1 Tax=Talaromyces proteolyticus TaxID=1131652 RepID=A0AAD4KM44_9EURO|nr:apses transcription factor StuA [Talaromyces proteolyticus]KAH8695952.1 apses transcription factor StuA [Talaromyces proteolyticus]
MNQTQSYMDVHSSHFSSPQPYGSHGATAGTMVPYSHYQQPPPVLPPGSTGYPSTPSSYSYPYSNGVTSTTQASSTSINNQVPTQILPLPAMTTHTVTPHGYVGGTNASSPQPSIHDPTGQTCPPGAKPRVTATLWEDEGSLCYQVEAKGVCVARREDNHMINGTKLLNVAGMTRGRRDGILKSEKVRHVVKIGPMHLKGVWIPYERALDFANKEKITDLLYPLFVHNIGGLLYHPTNSSRTNMVVHDSQQRRLEGNQSARNSQGPQGPALHHHHSMSNPVPSHLSQAPAPSVAPQSNGRPGLDRAHTFPTPPTSASSLIGMPNQGSTYEWNPQNMGSNVQPSQPLSIDTGLSNARSMPGTPATTPPGSNLQGIQPYQNAPTYDASKSYYSSAPPSQPQYASQPLAQPNLAAYGQAYMKNDMAPPSARPSIVQAEPDQGDAKVDRYAQPNGQVANSTSEAEPVQEPEPEYIHDAGAGSYSNRNSYTYTTNAPVGSLAGDHSQLAASPSHQNGADRMTPRTAGAASQQWPQGYNTPPRAVQAGSLSNIVSDTRGAPNGDAYPNSTYAPTYSSYSSMNGSLGTKRLRDDEDDRLGRPDGRETEYDSKRRKTITEPPVGGPVGGSFMQLQQPVTAGGVVRRR